MTWFSKMHLYILPASLNPHQARQTKFYFHQLFIFSLSHQVLTLFLESCYDASILVFPETTKPLDCSFFLLPALAV